MTVHELLSRISQRELMEWSAYEQATGPLGSERMDIWMARILQAVSNANSKTPKKLGAFIIDWYEMWEENQKMEEQRETGVDWQVMQANFAAATSGGRTKKK